MLHIKETFYISIHVLPDRIFLAQTKFDLQILKEKFPQKLDLHFTTLVLTTGFPA